MWTAVVLCACAWVGAHLPTEWHDALREAGAAVWRAARALPWHERV